MKTQDYIREDQENIVDVQLFWRLVALAMNKGLVEGFIPSPTSETKATKEFEASVQKSVREAIEKGRKNAGV